MTSKDSIVIVVGRPLTPAEKVAQILIAQAEAKEKAEEEARQEQARREMEQATAEQARIAALNAAQQVANQIAAARVVEANRLATLASQRRIASASKTPVGILNALVPIGRNNNIG